VSFLTKQATNCVLLSHKNTVIAAVKSFLKSANPVLFCPKTGKTNIKTHPYVAYIEFLVILSLIFVETS
jgi:hypothetical protein